MVFAFVSTVSAGLSRSQLIRIAKRSRETMPARGISGILMLQDGKFRGIVEGANHEVQRLVAQIVGDDRHHDISVTRFESIEKRLFDDWRVSGFGPGQGAPPGDAAGGADDLDKAVQVFFGNPDD